MSRGYQTHLSGFQHQGSNAQRYTSASGFASRAPLYPIGPTLTQP